MDRKERFQVAYPVKISVGDTIGSGIMTDVSVGGFRLRTDLPLEEGDQIEVSIAGLGDRPIIVYGEIRWTQENPPLMRTKYPVEIGVEVRRYEDDFVSFVQLQRRDAEFRDHPRFPEKVRTQLIGPGIWEVTYTLNLSRSGLFVRTETHIQEGQYVKLRLEIPGYDEWITLNGEVVFFISSECAEQIGVEPGIGIKITRMAQKDGEVFYNYVKRLEEKHI